MNVMYITGWRGKDMNGPPSPASRPWPPEPFTYEASFIIERKVWNRLKRHIGPRWVAMGRLAGKRAFAMARRSDSIRKLARAAWYAARWGLRCVDSGCSVCARKR